MKKITSFFVSLFFVVLSFYFSANSVLADMLPPGDKFYKVPKSERKAVLEVIGWKYVLLGLLIIIATIYSFSLIYKLRNGLPIFSFGKKKLKKNLAENTGEDKKEESFFSKFGIFILMILAGITAGSIPTATIIAKETGLTPLAILFFRYFIAFFCMLLVVIERKEFNLRNFKNNFIPSFFAILNPIALFYAISLENGRTTASVAILIHAIGPSLTALYFVIFQGRKLSNNQFFGILTGLAGVFLIIFQSLSGKGIGGIQGNLLALLSVTFFVTYAITSAKKQAEKIVSPYSLIFYSSILAMIISFIPMLESVQKVNLGIRQILALGWLGVISTVVFFVIFQFIVKKEGALVASVYAYLQATLGAIIGVVVLGERMTIYIIIGAVLTFIGSKITTMKAPEKKEEEKPKRVLKKRVVRKVKSQELSKEEISKSENEKSSSKTEDLKPAKKKIEKIEKIENDEENKK